MWIVIIRWENETSIDYCFVIKKHQELHKTRSRCVSQGSAGMASDRCSHYCVLLGSVYYFWSVWGGGGGWKFRNIFSGVGGAIFFNALFLQFCFRKSYITCILIVIGALQQHKGMFLKTWKGWTGKKFPTVSLGGAILFPCILEGGGGAFFCLSILPNHPPTPSGHK